MKNAYTELQEFIKKYTRNKGGKEWHERIECDKNALIHLINAFAIQVSEEGWGASEKFMRRESISLFKGIQDFTDYKPTIKQLE